MQNFIIFQHFDCLVGQGQVVLWLIPQSMKLHQPIFNFALKVLMYLRSFVRLIISSQFRRGLASYRSWFDSQIRKFLGIYYQVGRYLLFNCIVFKDHDFFFFLEADYTPKYLCCSTTCFISDEYPTKYQPRSSLLNFIDLQGSVAGSLRPYYFIFNLFLLCVLCNIVQNKIKPKCCFFVIQNTYLRVILFVD